MSDSAPHLLRAIARTLAPGRKILVCGASFETLQLLASQDVSELVVVTPDADPDAPTGETVHGAPLRLRPDWAERPRSKDLIIDESGEAPADEVVRVLKKQGIYLSLRETDALAALPESMTLTTEMGTSLLLAAGPNETTVETLLDPQPRPAGPPLFAGGKVAPSIPATMVTLPGDDSGAAPNPEVIVTLEAQLTEAAADAARAKAELTALQATHDEAMTAAAAVREELATLDAEYETLRDEVAKKRVDDRRVERIRTRYETAMQTLKAEVETLRLESRNLSEQHLDAETAAAARDAAEKETASLLGRLADGLARLLPPNTLPATPGPGRSAAQRAVLGAWLDAAMNAVDRQVVAAVREAEARAEANARIEDLERTLRETQAQLAAQTPVSLSPIELPTALAPDADARVVELEAALSAERGLRTADLARLAHAQRTAASAVQARNEMLDLLDTSRQAERDAHLSAALALETSSRLEAELAERTRRETELEEMLSTHVAMESLLADAVQDAETDRREAESLRRLADENLRVLRAEYERAREETTAAESNAE